MEPIEERIKARIAQLKSMRDKFVSDANTQIAAMNASIQELETLIAPPQPEQEKPAE